MAASASPVDEIVDKLVPVLREPVRSERARFVNRHTEVGRVEAAVDDPQFRTVWVFGFTGVGKTSLIKEAVKRIFEGASIVHVDVALGTGFVELALELGAAARAETLPVGLDQNAVESDIRYSLEVLAKDENFCCCPMCSTGSTRKGNPKVLSKLSLYSRWSATLPNLRNVRSF